MLAQQVGVTIAFDAHLAEKVIRFVLAHIDTRVGVSPDIDTWRTGSQK